MCLGVPGKVLRVVRRSQAGAEADLLAMGEVDFGGVRKEICLAYVPDVVPGDFVVVHAGFAISRVDPRRAAEVLRWLGADGGDG